MAAVQPAVSLIVGLGNPGPEYAQTRHNAGFWFVETVAARYGVELRRESKFHGWAGRTRVGGNDVWLLAPDTFMNRSGHAVAALARFFKFPVQSILVAHDELDLPPGVARLKRGGGHGGHNGLRSTAAALGSSEFARLRIGIGHPGHRDLVTPYVLGRPSADDRRCIEDAIDAAVDVLPQLVGGEFERAMNTLHSGRD
ncbi:MAG: aminoacyl-tRNA hydrolase [Gammaproteobacteria bacterium]